jgi:predicted nucleic acid-binding protein
LTYVIDASVALKWFLHEENSQGADDLFKAFLSGDTELLSPDVIILEVANTLWKQVALLKNLGAQEASSIFHDFLTLPLNLQSSGGLTNQALALALMHQHAVYDMIYCALAIERNCEFVTADQVLVSKVAKSLPFVRLLATIRT